MNKASRNLFMLTPLCLACGLAITAAYVLLNPRIEVQQYKAAETIYFDALQLQPGTAQLDSSHMTDDSVLLGLRTPQHIYIAHQDNHVIGIVLPLTAREGYGGDIDLLLGIDTDGKIISVHVVSHHETRDLGDKIEREKSNWLAQFHYTTFDDAQKNRWRLRSEGGEFDGITGATVTSRAVIKAVQQGLEYFALQHDELIEKQRHE